MSFADTFKTNVAPHVDTPAQAEARANAVAKLQAKADAKAARKAARKVKKESIETDASGESVVSSEPDTSGGPEDQPENPVSEAQG
jgi:hypothetical protein